VFISKNNDRLLSNDSIAALTRKLFPLALVVTPNLYEASLLTGLEIAGVEEMKKAAALLKETGAAYVLVKGGHLEGDAVDVLYDGDQFTELRGPRIESANTHGTGCTLSAAIAAHLALGDDVPAAVQKAKDYVTGAIRNGLALGKGHGPTNHGWRTTTS